MLIVYNTDCGKESGKMEEIVNFLRFSTGKSHSFVIIGAARDICPALCYNTIILCSRRAGGTIMHKLLIVEDDWEMNRGIAYALEKEGYTVRCAHSLREAKECYLAEPPELVLLDVNLPDGDGFAFCAWMQDKPKAAVLFLTARDLEEDVLKGYELGAEDYVTKPFSMKILLKRIAVIGKRNAEQTSRIFDDGFLYVDFDQAKAMVNGREQSFTPTELRLLYALISHAGQLLTYDVLLERLWDSGGQFVDKHALAVNVNRLRKKMEDDNHKYISNVYGMGYQWLK